MFGYWTDFERTVAAMDELRRRMEQAFEREGGAVGDTTAWPRVSLLDHGGELVLRADVPGLQEKELHLELTNGVLTVSGARGTDVPEGYSVHRQERRPVRFSPRATTARR